MKTKRILFVGVGLAALLLLAFFVFTRKNSPEPTQTIWEKKYNDLSNQHQRTLHDMAEQMLQRDTVYQNANDTTKIIMVMEYARALSMGVDSLQPVQAVTRPSP